LFFILRYLILASFPAFVVDTTGAEPLVLGNVAPLRGHLGFQLHLAGYVYVFVHGFFPTWYKRAGLEPAPTVNLTHG
jgi:hypothetical protein